MGLELREAMKIFPFSEAKLVAGYAGVGREVVSANIQEVPHVDRWLKGGEILFTAGYAFRNAKNGVEMMERLNQVGIAALAIKPGQYLPTIPPEMVACADRLGLPLFELPQELPYMDCIVSIFEQITQKQLSVMRRVENMHGMLTKTILNNEGLDGICNILNHVTNNPVFILNPAGAILACNVGAAPDKAYLEEMGAFFEDHCNWADVAQMLKNQCNNVHPPDSRPLIMVPIYVQNDHIAFLALDMNRAEVIEMDLIAFERASSMIAVELLNEQALMQKEQKMQEQFLEDLLERRYSDEKLMIQRGHHVGFNLRGKFCILVIDADSFEETLKKGMQNTPESEVQQIKTQVQQIICTGMNTYQRPSLVLDSSMGAVGMVSVRNADDVRSCIKILGGIIGKLETLNPHLSFSAGIGRVKQGLSEVQASSNEATLAMRAGRNIYRDHPSDRVYSFEDLGCLCFLSELSGSQAMRDFYRENMQALLDWDLGNNAELVKTLGCYFICKGNLRKTAEMLFVHKNSVIYRLNKVENLIGRKLEDHQTTFDLELCFKLRSIINIGTKDQKK